MVEIEILVPIGVQTCGEVPSYHWQFPHVAIDSYDSPSAETLYEVKKIRIPKDASAYKYTAQGETYVCWNRADPDWEQKKKKKLGMLQDRSDTFIPIQDDEWHPVEMVPRDWEDSGRFIRPIPTQDWIGVGTGLPLEFYGATGAVGFIRPDMTWEGLDVDPSVTDQSSNIDQRGQSFSVGLLNGIADFRMSFANWSGSQTLHVVGIDSLGRPVDEFVDRGLSFRWTSIAASHPILMTEVFRSAEWSLRADMRLGLGAGLLDGHAAGAISGLGTAASPQDARVVLPFVSGILQAELRFRGTISITLRVEFASAVSGGTEIDLSRFLGLDLGIEFRW
jgi:hypothetical protein